MKNKVIGLPKELSWFVATRKDWASIGWPTEVHLKAAFDVLMRERHGGKTQGEQPGLLSSKKWGIVDTAKALSETAGNVSRDIQLATALLHIPQLASFDSKGVAFRKLKELEAFARKLSKKKFLTWTAQECAGLLVSSTQLTILRNKSKRAA